MKKVFLTFLCCCLVFLFSYSDTVYLKNGKQIKGTIIEESKEYVKIEFSGVTLTYWMDEVSTLSKEDVSVGVNDSTHTISNIANKSAPIISVSRSQKQGKSFLWKVKSQNSTVYLLGSIHLGRPDFYPLDRVIESAFSKSDFLVVEADINAVDISTLQSVMEEAVYFDGSTLKDHLSSKTFRLAEQKMNEMGMSIEQMIVFKPWFLALNIEMIGYSKLGLDPTYGIDIYFLNKAKSNKKIVELESVEFQIKLLGSFNEKEQEAFLLSTLVDLDIVQDKIDKMIDLWKVGDALGMEQVFLEGIKKDPDLFSVYNKLLFKRNKGMVSTIRNFLNSRDIYFVVVGVAHLIGEQGIVNILEKEGYSVEQL